MLNISNYHKATSLQEAFELNLKRNNVVLGGMLWLKMQRRNIGTAIDLCNLGLDKVEETSEAFHIGAMVSLRDLETNKKLNEMTNDALAKSVEHLVGVQFRNLATVGGSVFSKFGFSDILTILLALDAKVELYKKGIISLEEFVAQKPERDILVRVIIDKKPYNTVFMSQKNSKTDFPVLNCAVTENKDDYTIVIGARPHKASVVKLIKQENIEEVAVKASESFIFGDNNLASATYRKHISKVLVKRSIEKLSEKE